MASQAAASVAWSADVTAANSIELPKPYTSYVIEVWHGSDHWVVSKRFSELYDFHSRMARRYPKLPNFPPRSTPLFSKGAEFIRKRRLALAAYLQEFFDIRVSGVPLAECDSEVREFFNMPNIKSHEADVADFVKLSNSHDLPLPDWGPYSSKFLGLSHVAPPRAVGGRLDLTLFPSFHRRRAFVPDLRTDSGGSVWDASRDLSHYTIRQPMEGRDSVYADISFSEVTMETTREARLLRVEFVNRTALPQHVSLHAVLSFAAPADSAILLPLGPDVRHRWLPAINYHSINFARPESIHIMPQAGLRPGVLPRTMVPPPLVTRTGPMPGADSVATGWVSPGGVGYGFGAMEGDSITFLLDLTGFEPDASEPGGIENASVLIRLRAAAAASVVFDVTVAENNPNAPPTTAGPNTPQRARGTSESAGDEFGAPRFDRRRSSAGAQARQEPLPEITLDASGASPKKLSPAAVLAAAPAVDPGVLYRKHVRVTATGGFQTVSTFVGSLPNPPTSYFITLRSRGGAAVELDGLLVLPADSLSDVVFAAPPLHRARPRVVRAPNGNAAAAVVKFGAGDESYGLSFVGETALGAAVDMWMHEDDEPGEAAVRRAREGGGMAAGASVLSMGMDAGDTNGEPEPLSERRIPVTPSALSLSHDGFRFALSLGPFTLAPDSQISVSGHLCAAGSPDAAAALLARLAKVDADAAHSAGRASRAVLVPTEAGVEHHFTINRAAAALLGAVQYPVEIGGLFCRHVALPVDPLPLNLAPAAHAALGFIHLHPTRAAALINAYTNGVLADQSGRPGALASRTFIPPMVVAGAPSPMVIYAFMALYNATQSLGLLKYMYPRMRAVHRCLSGTAAPSPVRTTLAGFLVEKRPNVSGAANPATLTARTSRDPWAPIVLTAHALRCTKLLMLAASLLGDECMADMEEYDGQVSRLAAALACAWDPAVGYYGYAVLQPDGGFKEVLRRGRDNANRGLEGVLPLITGECPPDHVKRMLAHLQSPQELDGPHGWTTVAQSAPYYKADAEQNGCVVLSQHYVLWRTLLDLGEGQFGYNVACKLLATFGAEIKASNIVCESFLASTGRGVVSAGRGADAGVIVAFYSAYYKPGTLTTGLDMAISECVFSGDSRSLMSASLVRLPPTDEKRASAPSVVVCVLPSHTGYHVAWNGQSVSWFSELCPGALNISVPIEPESRVFHGTLSVRPLAPSGDKN